MEGHYSGGLSKTWYFDLPDFKARVGFEFTFESTAPARRARSICAGHGGVVGKKLSYSWRMKGLRGIPSLHSSYSKKDRTDEATPYACRTGDLPFNRVAGMETKDFAGGWTHFIGTA